ncbi:hypothetical protein NM688_g4528 [Phlebia brevispora]|uniref:Uncharacterized protein n=1 Tax=Phlebia brevispora TaxID=194682 RepID=A0ACC1T2Q1_9APHY|nr:hypothetical protein NM688_g4528 [Phlebia brevispora]
MSNSEEGTLSDPLDHVRIVREDSVSDVIDPRITPEDRADEEQLDESYFRQASDYAHHRPHPAHHEKPPGSLDEKEGPLYVEFEKNDPRDPMNFSKLRKWVIAITAISFTALSGQNSSSASGTHAHVVAPAANASSYNIGYPDMTRELNCTNFEATIGLSTYTLGFAITPLVTASFSEEFGRQPLYLFSGIGFAMMHLVVATAHNIHTIQIARFFGGAFGSTGSTMVGGTIADIFLPHE